MRSAPSRAVLQCIQESPLRRRNPFGGSPGRASHWMSDTVAIEDLKVGMFIHLEGGWMSHPFALSSFRIETDHDIGRLRALGLRRLRWSPERSEAKPLVSATVAATAHEATPLPPPLTPEQQAAAQHTELLQAQSAAARLCEAQFDEASSALGQVIGAVRERPLAARDSALALSQALLSKLVPDAEMCVRVLGEQAGERPTTHSLNVTVISMLMGRMFAFADDEMIQLAMGALLHDIGKLDLPQRLQHHEERFTQSEIADYRDHVKRGAAHGHRMGLAAAALEVIEQHHECADGSGYPARLSMDRMSAPSRIVSLVNRYDNLCNPRTTARALTPHEALSRLFAQGKGKFDSTMLTAFIRMMGVYPAGSLVQLTDERYALVTHANASRPLKPRVLVHDAALPREQALLVNLADNSDLGIRRSLPLSQLPKAAHEYLQPAPRVAYFFEPALAAPEMRERPWA